jgi:hypothetical protein
MKAVALGYGDPATWGGREPSSDDDEIEQVKLNWLNEKSGLMRGLIIRLTSF